MGCGTSAPASKQSRPVESSPLPSADRHVGTLLCNDECATVASVHCPPISVDRDPVSIELLKDSETSSAPNFATLFSQNMKSFTPSLGEGMQQSHGTRVSVECLRSNSAVLDTLSRISTYSRVFEERNNEFDGEAVAPNPSAYGEDLVELWNN